LQWLTEFYKFGGVYGAAIFPADFRRQQKFGRSGYSAAARKSIASAAILVFLTTYDKVYMPRPGRTGLVFRLEHCLPSDISQSLIQKRS